MPQTGRSKPNQYTDDKEMKTFGALLVLMALFGLSSAFMPKAPVHKVAAAPVVARGKPVLFCSQETRINLLS
jgi:hypothetical protein